MFLHDTLVKLACYWCQASELQGGLAVKGHNGLKISLPKGGAEG